MKFYTMAFAIKMRFSQYWLLSCWLLATCAQKRMEVPSYCPQYPMQWERLLAATPDSAFGKCLEAHLMHLHEPLPAPSGNSWRTVHTEDPQSYSVYLQSMPKRPNRHAQKLYLRKIGAFTVEQERIVKITAQYLSVLFAMPCQVLDSLPSDHIPNGQWRYHPGQGHKQLLSTFLLYGILKPQVPDDAALMLGFTAADLYPAPSWNYVFGQAALYDRVGVWSIYRFGNPGLDERSYKICLFRALKTASHETAHALSLPHCLFYKCNMNGSNHLDELDASPPQPCPVCWSKICWNLGVSPFAQAKQLHAFWKTLGFPRELQYYHEAIKSLGGTHSK
jgi:archaemetzincin